MNDEGKIQEVIERYVSKLQSPCSEKAGCQLAADQIDGPQQDCGEGNSCPVINTLARWRRATLRVLVPVASFTVWACLAYWGNEALRIVLGSMVCTMFVSTYIICLRLQSIDRHLKQFHQELLLIELHATQRTQIEQPKNENLEQLAPPPDQTAGLITNQK